MPSRLRNLPSIIWVIILPVCLVLFIGTIIAAFTALATVEGFASIIILAVGFLSIRAAATEQISTTKVKGSGLAIAAGLCFFALMGMAIDQPGNIIYNKPIELLFCPENTTLVRGVDVLHPTPGRTDIIQDFNCVDHDYELVQSIDIFAVIIVRFVEYIFIGYLLIGLNRMISRIRANRVKHDKNMDLTKSSLNQSNQQSA